MRTTSDDQLDENSAFARADGFDDYNPYDDWFDGKALTVSPHDAEKLHDELESLREFCF
jgi:hypothetical protein